MSVDPRLIALFALAAIALTIWLLVSALVVREQRLTVSAGHELERRYELAQVLAGETRRRGVVLDFVTTNGSEDAIGRVARRELDVALVQGGLSVPEHVQEVAALVLEPLHLLVKGEVEFRSLRDLFGHTVNISIPGSGTHTLALQVLEQAELEPGRDLVTTELDYDALRDASTEDLPDAVFVVSPLPSTVATMLVRQHGFHVVPLPISGAMRIRHPGVRETTIPAFAYSGRLPMPPNDVITLATRTLLIAHDEVEAKTVRRLVDAVLSDRFARAASLTHDEEEALLADPELPLHEGTHEYLSRNDPLMTPEIIDNVESLRSFFVSLAIAIFLGWRWFRAKQLRGFDVFITEVSDLEVEIHGLELHADLDLEQLVRIRRRLGVIKARGLREHREGRLASSELLNAFLLHVTDVRMHLDALILHARERLEKKARRVGGASDEDAILLDLWRDALGDDLDA